MKIEVPKINDYERINQLAVDVHNLHVKWDPSLFYKEDNMMSKEILEDLINKEEIFVAKDNDEVVGYIIFEIVEKLARGIRYRKQLNINVICVDEKNRNQGIGSSLLNYIKQYALDNNCTDLYLTVNEQNKHAIHVYEKFGFKVKNIAYSMQIK